MEIHWKTNLELSAMHAAWCLSSFAADCKNCSPELQQAAAELTQAAELLGIPLSRFWELLLVLAIDSPLNRDLAERIMIRSLPAGARTERVLSSLSAAIAAVESQFARGFPNFQNDMRLRTEPLKQQWEAYGPGLLRLIANWTAADLLPREAEVVVVQPIVGGAGFPHLQTNRCHIEALLTNNDPALTETLRLAWLLAQLEFDRPVYSDLVNAFRLRRIGGLAMLPATLLAAQGLELCPYSAAMLEKAITSWRMATPDENPAALSQVLMSWWETVEAGQPDWRIALTGLDRMLP